MKFLKTVLIIMTCVNVFAQGDIQFSQFYASPLTLNPALTGKFNGHFRVGGIFREQFFNLYTGAGNGDGPLFRTPSASIDAKIIKGARERNFLGAGLTFVNDIQNAGTFNDLRFFVSTAYTMSLGSNAKSQLSIGVQGMYHLLSTDFTKIANIKTPDGIGSETFTGSTKKAFDLSGGLFFNTKLSDRTTWYIGTSAFNLLSPSVNFLPTSNNSDVKLPRRYVGHTGFEVEVGKNKKWIAIPGLLYMNQASSQQENFGITMGYKLKEEENSKTVLYIGCWNRWNALKFESIIPKIGVEVGPIRVWGAYDMNLGGINANQSSTPQGNNPVSSFEIAAQYIGVFKPGIKEEIYLFNPRY
jgi:type IX secretion system PorP/SprF family membrane protein